MNKIILVVDDSAVIRSLHRYILGSQGYTVETASNGVDAIEKLYRNDHIALAIVDVNMPKMDGLQFIRTIRKERAYRDLPVIIVTCEEEDEQYRKGIESGANIYMVKPTRPDELIKCVKMLMPDEVQ